MRCPLLNKQLIPLCLLVFLIATLFIACENLPQNEMNAPSYLIYYETFQYTKDYSYQYCQISGLNDKKKEEQINQALKEGATSWTIEKIIHARAQEPYVVFQSDRYLTVSYFFEFPSGDHPFFNVIVTIDMQEGKRVWLNDLVDTNIDFVKKLRDEDIAVARDLFTEEQKTADERERSFLKGHSYEELSMELLSCSEDVDEYIAKWNVFPSQNTFYISESGKLEIVFGGPPTHGISLDLDDIEEFLKVEKW